MPVRPSNTKVNGEGLSQSGETEEQENGEDQRNGEEAEKSEKSQQSENESAEEGESVFSSSIRTP